MDKKALTKVLENIFKQNPYMTFENFNSLAKSVWNDVQNEKIEKYHPIPIEEIKRNKSLYNAEVEHEETVGIQDESLDDDSNIQDENDY